MVDRDASVIAIDGPSASGKGTVSKRVAGRLGFHLLDSGALYRIAGFAAEERHIDLDDGPSIAAMLDRVDIMFCNDDLESQDGVVYLDGRRLGPELRTEEAGHAASRVAKLPEVRAALVDRQRAFQRLPGLVADGRDMGSVIFPQAELKIYLDASPEERAKRRYNQLKVKGIDVSLTALLADIEARDERDRNRETAPLAVAPGAHVIDTSQMGIEEAVSAVLELWRSR
ncbi:MAG: (d)CMP kinase [Gammaproteobacteria bacterium]|nr:(d)CMP kinase [Gammaproteobacteria bacterium]